MILVGWGGGGIMTQIVLSDTFQKHLSHLPTWTVHKEGDTKTNWWHVPEANLFWIVLNGQISKFGSSPTSYTM